ncbi:MAG: XTP/dITP diphosphatase [Candidatus Hydrothermarchaeales archaeon]
MFYFQTTNRHKFAEAQEILGGRGIEIERIPKEYREVQAARLEEVALQALGEIERKGVFIEDSGLFVKALKGFPGVYSSNTLETIGVDGILKLMQGVDNRNAEFVSIIGLKTEEVKLFKGIVKGSISLATRGNSGFGYDPIFVPEGYERTFAEDIKLKNEISHRRRALDKLANYIKKGESE